MKNNLAIKKCGFCDIEFIPNSSKQICCSKLCNTKKWRRDNPEKARINDRKASENRKGKRLYSSEYRKEWYERIKQNKEWLDKKRQSSNERSRKVKEFISNYKIEKGCTDCGYNSHHSALDFDHIIGVKSINVSNAKSISQALKEIEKCEVVCANCHRIRTYNRIHKL